MTPRARLVAGSLALVAVSGFTIGATRATWFRVTLPGSGAVQVPDVGSVRFPARVESFDAAQAGGIAAGMAVLLIVCALAVLLAGPRVRRVLLALAAVAAIAICADAATSDAPDATRAGAERTVWPMLTAAGAFASAVIAALLLPVAGRVPRFGMPENAPEA